MRMSLRENRTVRANHCWEGNRVPDFLHKPELLLNAPVGEFDPDREGVSLLMQHGSATPPGPVRSAFLSQDALLEVGCSFQ